VAREAGSQIRSKLRESALSVQPLQPLLPIKQIQARSTRITPQVGELGRAITTTILTLALRYLQLRATIIISSDIF